ESVDKHEKETDSNEDCSRGGNCPRAPECNPNQRRTQYGAGNKHDVVIAHDPIVYEPLCQCEEYRIASHARDLITQRILGGEYHQREHTNDHNKSSNTR